MTADGEHSEVFVAVAIVECVIGAHNRALDENALAMALIGRNIGFTVDEIAHTVDRLTLEFGVLDRDYPSAPLPLAPILE